MATIRKIVLDVVKPQEPPITTIAKAVADVEGVDGVNVSLLEIDRKVENVRVTVVGDRIDVRRVMDIIESIGAAIHSIDEVAAGKELIEHAVTLEDEA